MDKKDVLVKVAAVATGTALGGPAGAATALAVTVATQKAGSKK